LAAVPGGDAAAVAGAFVQLKAGNLRRAPQDPKKGDRNDDVDF
jgi:hypothetical protein